MENYLKEKTAPKKSLTRLIVKVFTIVFFFPDLPILFFGLAFSKPEQIGPNLIFFAGLVLIEFIFIAIISFVAYPFIGSERPVRNALISVLYMIGLLIIGIFAVAVYKVFVLHY
jgi:hypothetical protein